MPRSVADALAEWQLQAPEGVPFISLKRERFETVSGNWQRCRNSLACEGGKHPRPWQTRDVVNNVLRSVKRHAKQAGIELAVSITVHTFRKSYGQNDADNGTPIHVLQ
jgi:integrase